MGSRSALESPLQPLLPRAFTALGVLDLRGNRLALDDLLAIRGVYIAHLRIDGNLFTPFTDSCPLTLPAVFERAWIIDGQFISDFIRTQSRAFSRTLAFGETVLACRRFPTALPPQTGPSQGAATFLGTVRETGEILSAGGIQLKNNDHLSQIYRLRHLSSLCPPSVPPGEFYDYFALALAILSVEWIMVGISPIPNVFCPAYWKACGEEIERLEPFERLLLLLKIADIARPDGTIQTELWNSLGVMKFVNSGDIPMRGAPPRLLICAFLERTQDIEDNIDRPFYLKIRELGGFNGRDPSLQEIYEEMIAPIPSGVSQGPNKGEKVSVLHPVSREWVEAVCLFCKNGRVYTKFESDFIQLPLIGLFCDKGRWREARRRKEALRGQSELDVIQAHFPTMPEIGYSDTRALLRRNLKVMSSSKFIDRSVKPIETFRGIIEPIKPPHTVLRRSAPTRKPTQVIQDVVNVTFGAEMGHGRRVRRFNVRVQNVLTGKSQYQWVDEDEVTPGDVELLARLYKTHIEGRMTIMPGL
jgi:hypothetical protein